MRQIRAAKCEQIEGVKMKLGTGAICFDTDLLRYAAAWDGGWLELLGPPFEGSR